MNSPTLGREHYLELLNEITQAAIGTLDLNDMLQTLADRLGELFMADACHIALWDEARQIPIPAAASGTAREAFLSLQVKPGQQTLTAALLKLGRVLAVPDVANTIYIDPEIVAKFPQKRSFLGLPFIASGQGLGAAILGFDRPRQFHFGNVAAIAPRQSYRHKPCCLMRPRRAIQPRAARAGG